MLKADTGGRIVLTGASGFLGRSFCDEWKDRMHIIGTGKAHPPAEGCAPAFLDLDDPDSFPGFLDTARPDGVVHCAALSKPDECLLRPESSERVNFFAPVRLAELCAERGIRFVFVSTDLVFDGTGAPYDESAPTSPISLYGEHKAQAEQGVLEQYPGAAVCRMPVMYGLGRPHAPSFLDGMLSAVRGGRVLRLFTDETRSFASVRDGARGLGLVLMSSESGIFHLGGPDRMTRFELGEIFNRIIGRRARIEACVRADVNTPVPRPADVSLNSTRARALGCDPETVEQGLTRVLRNISL